MPAAESTGEVLSARSQDGLNFSVSLAGIDDGMMRGSEYRGIEQFSPSKQFKGTIRLEGEGKVSWKKIVRGLRLSAFKTRIGENDWRVAKSLGYLPLNLNIDEDLHPEFRFKEAKDVAVMLCDALEKIAAVKHWWEFWQ